MFGFYAKNDQGDRGKDFGRGSGNGRGQGNGSGRGQGQGQGRGMGRGQGRRDGSGRATGQGRGRGRGQGLNPGCVRDGGREFGPGRPFQDSWAAPTSYAHTPQAHDAACPLCDNHCPLSNPGCDKGLAYAEARNAGQRGPA